LAFTLFFFFFSSRRRHTRFSRDWSSDVCSSDLALDGAAVEEPAAPERRMLPPQLRHRRHELDERLVDGVPVHPRQLVVLRVAVEIGRASCRKEGRARGAPCQVKQNGSAAESNYV